MQSSSSSSQYGGSGEWVKGKLIGSGSYGHVHIAMNKGNGDLFVVKSSKSEIGWKSLENEANILMNLKDSRYIVNCLGKEVTHEPNGECIYNIFLEHIGGGSISDIADRFGGTLCEEVVRSYTKQILTSLNYLHEQGIVHCDIKCKNVLLDSHGKVKLADFGCARLFKKTQNNNQSFRRLQYVGVGVGVGGTPLWMAPEVLRGERLDATADIWTLGCTIIEMATGKLPWGEDIMSNNNPMSSVFKIAKTKQKPQLPHNFSKQGLDFLDKCLQRNPMKRWTAPQLLLHPFVSVINHNNMTGYDNLTASPASVLDHHITFSDYEDDRIPGSLSHRGLVSMPRHTEPNNSSLGCRIPDLETSKTWIIVRST